MYCHCKTQTSPRICQKIVKDTEKEVDKKAGMEETEKENIVT